MVAAVESCVLESSCGTLGICYILSPGFISGFVPYLHPFVTFGAQLLARLVRDYGRACRFITAGGASSLMALPGESAFEGSTALLAVVFRCPFF